MKTPFVADLQDGQAVASLFLVREKEVRTSTNTGKAWLQLSLADRTGSIAAKMWDNFAAIENTFQCDDIVRIRGRVKLYRNEKELTIEQILPVTEAEYLLDDFLPHTPHDVEKLYAQLRESIAAMQNPWLRRLLCEFADDPELAAKLKRAPAAMTMHHAYLGGLLEHILSLCGLAKHVCTHYPEVDADLLLTGIVLHDIGKTQELSYRRAISYTAEGQLLGHIILGLAMVQRKIAAIPEFPQPLAILVEHMIVSHHGELEFGSPKVPAMREAVLLHYLDDLDSKMAAMRDTLGRVDAAQIWTERNAALRRNLLNSAAFLNGLAGKAPGSASRELTAARSPAPGSTNTTAQKTTGPGQLFSDSVSSVPSKMNDHVKKGT